MLERDIVERIEELHGAVIRAEAEQRFGLLRGKRSRQLVEAEAAEREFLDEQGFATYNDFRLRIRRSTSFAHEEVSATESTFVWDDGDDGAGAHGPAVDVDGRRDEDAHDHTDSDIDGEAGDDAPGDDHHSQEGSEHMAPLPEPAPVLSAPAPVPAFAPRGDSEAAPPGAADFRRLTEPLFATLQAETDRFVASRLETAEKQAAEILNRASREAAEIIGRAARMHDAVKSLVDDVTRQSESFLAVTEDLPARVTAVRESVTSDLQALRDLAENGPGKVAPLAEPSSVWNAPARVAPPPPVPAAGPAE